MCVVGGGGGDSGARLKFMQSERGVGKKYENEAEKK